MDSRTKPHIISCPVFHDPNGSLYVYDMDHGIPFSVVRSFCVQAPAGELRGNHAHYECQQLLICLSGRILCHTEHHSGSQSFELSNPQKALFLPPMTWATQTYVEPGSILFVLCDQKYEANDYIRSHENFVISLRELCQ